MEHILNSPQVSQRADQAFSCSSGQWGGPKDSTVAKTLGGNFKTMSGGRTIDYTSEGSQASKNIQVKTGIALKNKCFKTNAQTPTWVKTPDTKAVERSVSRGKLKGFRGQAKL